MGNKKDKTSTGHLSTGNHSTGNYSTGNYSTGEHSSGNYSTGDYSTGDWSTGDHSTGSFSTGDYSTGNRSIGHYSTGDYSTGNISIGDYSTGTYSTGDYSTGNYSTGNRSTGECSTGDYSTGDFSTADYSTGAFQTVPTEFTAFNKPCDKNVWQKAKKPEFFWCFRENLVYWVDDENIKPQGGELRAREYKEAWTLAWEQKRPGDVQKLLALPNFDQEVFKEATGIDLSEKIITEDRLLKMSSEEKIELIKKLIEKEQ